MHTDRQEVICEYSRLFAAVIGNVRPPAINQIPEMSTLNWQNELLGAGRLSISRELNGLNLLKACGVKSCLPAQLFTPLETRY